MKKRHQHNENVLLILIFIFPFIIPYNFSSTCNGKQSYINDLILVTSNKETNSMKEVEEKEMNIVDKTVKEVKDYVLDCKEMDFWEGSIQGSGSSELYILGECYNRESSYDVILVPKMVYENNLTKFNNNRNKWDDYFTAFVFFVGRKKSDNPENEFDKYEYIFPFKVKVVKYSNSGEWIDIGRYNICSFEELGKLKVLSVKKYKSDSR